MSTIDDIKNMRKEGKTEDEIVQALRNQGIPEGKISDSLNQANIKNAIESQDHQEGVIGGMPSNSSIQEYQEMQPSMLSSQEQEEFPVSQQPSPQNAYEFYPQSQQQPYQEQYQQYQGQLSSDTITEIADQVLSEKLSSIRKKLDENINLKNVMQTKLDIVDERLKRMEKIIDQLQLSILQKVGDYLANTADLKKELLETQKSFKSSPHKKH